MAILASGCGDEPADPAGGTGTVPARHPDIVVSISSTGFQGDPGARAPDFELRRGGTVFVTGDASPFGIDHYRLTGEGIAHVRDLLADVSTDDDSYGDLSWTDQGTTNMYLNLDGPPEGVAIYALRTATDPDDLSGELTDRQIQARLDLLDTLSALDELSERDADGDPLVAESRDPYTPDQIELTLLPATPYPQATPIEWPLDPPLVERPLHWSRTRLCTVLRGHDAAQIAPLVERWGVQQPHWSTGVAEDSPLPDAVRVEVHGLLPGVDGPCAERGTPVQQDPGGQDRQLSAGPFDPLVLADPSGWQGRWEADRFPPATALEVYAVAPVLEDGVAGYGEAPTGAGLTWYEYRAVAAEVGGARYLDVEAYLPESWRDPGEVVTWGARVDLAGKEVVAIELDR